MCLIGLNWQPNSARRLLLVANRDEFHRRPTRPAQTWDESDDCIGGRDLLAGGAWLASNQTGRFAAVTNVRLPSEKNVEFEKSRGALVKDFMLSNVTAATFVQTAMRDSQRYAGFNLLACDGEHLFHCNNRSHEINELSAGIHVVSNGSIGDHWPKMETARKLLHTSQNNSVEALMRGMADTHIPADEFLPDTGVGKQFERYVAPVFIAGQEYGTRATTVLIHDASGGQFSERRFGPNSVLMGESHFRWQH